MQQESNVKNSKISIQSFGSNFSNFSFLKDVPKGNRQSYRDSLKYCMSVQSDKKSDIYQKLINQNQQVKTKSIFGSGLGINNRIQNNSNASLRQSYDPKKSGNYFNSDIHFSNNSNNMPNSKISQQNIGSILYQNYQIMHTCTCVQKCQNQCPCYTALQDDCILGFCCPNCVEDKKKILQMKYEQSLKQQNKYNYNTYNNNFNSDDLKPCTCKKTKCNKKYCACYAAGKKCTKFCTCDQCTNCQFYQYTPTQPKKPVTYLEQQYENQNMPQRMDFQPCQFPEL